MVAFFRRAGPLLLAQYGDDVRRLQAESRMRESHEITLIFRGTKIRRLILIWAMNFLKIFTLKILN